VRWSSISQQPGLASSSSSSSSKERLDVELTQSRFSGWLSKSQNPGCCSCPGPSSRQSYACWLPSAGRTPCAGAPFRGVVPTAAVRFPSPVCSRRAAAAAAAAVVVVAHLGSCERSNSMSWRPVGGGGGGCSVGGCCAAAVVVSDVERSSGSCNKVIQKLGFLVELSDDSSRVPPSAVVVRVSAVPAGAGAGAAAVVAGLLLLLLFLFLLEDTEVTFLMMALRTRAAWAASRDVELRSSQILWARCSAASWRACSDGLDKHS